jgi:hypothetical protein
VIAAFGRSVARESGGTNAGIEATAIHGRRRDGAGTHGRAGWAPGPVRYAKGADVKTGMVRGLRFAAWRAKELTW